MVVYPIIYMVWYILPGERRISEPSTVGLECTTSLGITTRGENWWFEFTSIILEKAEKKVPIFNDTLR